MSPTFPLSHFFLYHIHLLKSAAQIPRCRYLSLPLSTPIFAPSFFAHPLFPMEIKQLAIRFFLWDERPQLRASWRLPPNFLFVFILPYTYVERNHCWSSSFHTASNAAGCYLPCDSQSDNGYLATQVYFWPSETSLALAFSTATVYKTREVAFFLSFSRQKKRGVERLSFVCTETPSLCYGDRFALYPHKMKE